VGWGTPTRRAGWLAGLYQAELTACLMFMTTLTSLVLRLPWPLPQWAANARTLIRHPRALTTIGVIFRPNREADAGTPWWNDRAIRYITEQLRPGDQVFEWGSGASTIWLCDHGAKVISIEHDADWVEKVASRCPTADIRAIPGSAENDEYIEDQADRSGDYIGAIDEFADGSFDIVIVDGLYRPECLRRGASKVKPGGLLILDDTDRQKLARVRKTALPQWKKVSFTGFKASKDVRETTFFRRPRGVGA